MTVSAACAATPRATATATPQHAAGQGGGDGVSLPWLADRFYLNLLPPLRGGSSSSNDFFSLEKLVHVVSGDGRPGIKAAIFGTFSLEMGYVSRQTKPAAPSMPLTPPPQPKKY